MKVSVSPGHNINGTLILPLFEGSEEVPESLEAGLHTALKGQINVDYWWRRWESNARRPW